MKFLEPGLEEEYKRLNFNLQNIVQVIEALTFALYRVETMVTSVYRPDKNSPHAYWRAVDLRSNLIPSEDCMKLINTINLIFPYGKGNYQTMLWHDVGYGWHFHVQVKP